MIAVLGAVVAMLGAIGLAAGDEIAAPAAYERAASGNLTIIDVRRPSEWRETGLPEGAVGISLHNMVFLERGDFAADVAAALGGDRDAPVATICAAGVRSARAEEILRDAGFTNVVNIGEGMMGNDRVPGWIRRALPRRPCPDC